MPRAGVDHQDEISKHSAERSWGQKLGWSQFLSDVLIYPPIRPFTAQHILGHILLSWLGRFYTSLCHSYRCFFVKTSAYSHEKKNPNQQPGISPKVSFPFHQLLPKTCKCMCLEELLFALNSVLVCTNKLSWAHHSSCLKHGFPAG